MAQKEKTKEELLAEIALLQKRIADLARGDTERRKIEEALRGSEEQLRALVDNISLGITYIDKDYNVVFTNKAQGELFRRPPAEFSGKHCFSEFEKRDGICPHCPGKIAMATGRKAEAESVGQRQDGSSFQAHIDAFPFFLQGGKIAGFIEVVEDITERKKAEALINKLVNEQRTIFNSVPAMIWYKDARNNILRVNQSGAKSMGRTVEEIERKSIYELLPEDADHYYQDDMEVINSGKPKLGIVEVLQTASGEKLWVQTDKIPYRDEKGNAIGVIVFSVNITERRQTEETLKRKMEELERFNKIAVDRELKMIELKEKIKALEKGKNN